MSTTMLKWVALVLMLLDHLGEFFPQSVPLWFRWLGRMSAPLFLFCLAQGLEKTRSRPRYLRRLWTGSAVMGLGSFALTLLFPQAPVAISNNIFSTMAVIACIVWIYESFDGASPRRDNLKNPEAALAFFVAGQVLIVLVSILAQRGGVIWVRLINALLPNLVFCEGSLDVVILGLLLYFTRKNRRWLSVGYLFYCGLQLFSSLTVALEVGNWSWLWLRAYQWMMVGSLPLMLCYNGERGRGGGKFFYLFYPAHIWILFVLSNLMAG